MAEFETTVRSTLQTNKYREIDKTKRDALEVLGFYRGLKPANEQFVFNNGVNKTMLALKGTIPINYKGNTYNIPIYIWLMDTHPHNAPMVFVKPTSDMKIKVSRHVDHNGKVYLPYLHDWKSTSDLLDLIQVLIITFQDQPPVYAVMSSPPPQPQMPIPMNMPYPTQNYATPYPPVTAMPMPPMSMSMPSPPMMPPSHSQALPAFSMRPSLITAAEEKLRRRLEDIYLAAEIERKTGEHVRAGKDKLEHMMKRLDEEKSTLLRNMEVCQNETAQLDTRIAESQEEKVVDTEDAIQAPTPLHKQIVNTFAEEAAIEDTIYYLSEAFRNGKMDLEQFQKHIRALARKQFALRALLQKCRQNAGLAG